MHSQLASSICLITGLALPVYGPALQSSFSQGDQSIREAGTFEESPGENFVRVRWTGAGLCGYITGWPLLSPLQAQPMLFGKGKKCLPTSYRLAGNIPNEILFGSTLPSPGGPTPLSLVPQGLSVLLEAGIYRMCLSQRLSSGTRKKCLALSCRFVWLIPTPIGDSFDLPSWAPVSPCCWACCCRGDSWLHPTWTCGLFLLKELKLKTLAKTEWIGSGVGVTVPSLRSWMQGP